MPSILFVCSANQCRSPMAEVLFQHYLNKKGIAGDWRVESAGVWAMDGVSATANAHKVMMERGLSLAHHKSQSVRAQLIREFDLVLVMENRHRVELRKAYPEVAHRVHLLTAMVDEARDVNDPVLGTIETYRVTAGELEDLINRGFKRIQEMVSEVPE